MKKTRSLDEIRDLEESYSEDGYFWIHPKSVISRNKQTVNDDTARGQKGKIDEFRDTPDTILTDYLCKCLDKRKAYIDSKRPIPEDLDISIYDYVDALIYLISELHSSYACHILGSTNYHNDDLFNPTDASAVLQRLKEALLSTSDGRTAELIRTLLLEMFHVGYPWATPPRFHEFLHEDDVKYIQELLENGPLAPP